MKKIALAACLILAVVWGILAIAQLWFEIVLADIFWKLSLTLGILITLTLLVALAINEYFCEKDMKAKGYLGE